MNSKTTPRRGKRTLPRIVRPRCEKMWAITGVFGLYSDTAFTKRDMISQHTAALGKTWAYCKRKGDYAVRVMVVPLIEARQKFEGRLLAVPFKCWLGVLILLAAGCSEIREANDALIQMAEAQQRLDDLAAKMEADRPKWDAWQKDMDRMNKEFWERDAEIQRRFQEMGITNTPNASGQRREPGAGHE